MESKDFITALGFCPKNGAKNIYQKVYESHDNYVIAVDFDKNHIDYGKKITAESKTTQNFSQSENFVVLECVDRLLQKGYKPEHIVLEKTWPSGHGTSGRLDICVNREDGTPYLLVECKTYGKEFDKESNKIHKDGGQLFTYFQLSGGKADLLMLYASEYKGKQIVYKNEIIKIEDEYRNGEVKDIYEKWNKLTKDNGVFEDRVQPYNFKSKALTLEQLKEITTEDSSFIFNRFLEILRHNVVSDKGNAFNKIFTLFLCKVYDETTAKDGEELQFQWIEGQDNHIEFQLRLTHLYKEGMKLFLERTVSDFDNENFSKRCAGLNEETKKYLLEEITKLRLEKNNEFAIKEVYDHASFEENARVVKEVVELIQGYRIRYNKRQQYLSDFFELLLTTGLKQEAGQFFTPVPIAQFIIKCLPLDVILADRLKRKDDEILPYMIDYAAGSGHFITEYMHEVQNLLNQCDGSKYIDKTQKKIKQWQAAHFDWATQYVYGVEKDYRLVKVGKVGCYLHGDGLANVMLSDGLANFYENEEYKERLRKKGNDNKKDHQQFDIVLSNPPYSVSSFRQTTRNYYTEKDFELYDALTDNSSEIECLFVERTKQLLKDGGVAGVILPSSILSNSGIYTKTREIILQYFDIVAVAELGSNTFMATGTNTVVLFLRRRDNYFAANTRQAVDAYFQTLRDVTINGIETPVAKYVAHVWDGLAYSDYVTLLQKTPNNKVKAHEIYTEYKSKISAKGEDKLIEAILGIEAEKLLYFILAYPQQVVVVKSGDKDEEKRFLGYEFSSRRGSEGIHAIQRGKNIDECTQLFDAEKYDNPNKAGTYIYRAFKGDYTSEIAESMKQHVSRLSLVDMLTFDRSGFEKNISLNAKKKVRYEQIWKTENIVPLIDVAVVQKGSSITKEKITKGIIPVVAGGKEIAYYHNKANREGNIITISASGKNAGFVNYFQDPIFASDCNTVKSKAEETISTKLIYQFLKRIQPLIYDLQKGQAQPHVYGEDIAKIKIPIPIKSIQEKIVAEIEAIERKTDKAKENIENRKKEAALAINQLHGTKPIKEFFDINTKTINPLDIWKDEEFTYVDIDCVGKGNGCVRFDNKMLGKDAPSRARRIAENKTAIISTVRPYLKGFAFIENTPDKTIFSTGFALLKSKEENKYLAKLIYLLFMFSEDLMKQMEAVMTKAAYPSINKEDIENFIIPVPSIKEQQQIVARIEKMEAEITAARAIIDNAAKEKQAVLDRYL